MEIEEDKLYTDEQGNEYIKRSPLEDKRVYRDSEGDRYIEHPTPVRVFVGVLAVVVLGVGILILFWDGNMAAYGRSAGIIEFLNAYQYGNIIAFIITLLFAVPMLYYAYIGQEKVIIEQQ